MKTTLLVLFAFLTAFLSIGAVGEFTHGDSSLFAILGMGAFFSASAFQATWEEE
jgi:hypothetical protein